MTSFNSFCHLPLCKVWCQYNLHKRKYWQKILIYCTPYCLLTLADAKTIVIIWWQNFYQTMHLKILCTGSKFRFWNSQWFRSYKKFSSKSPLPPILRRVFLTKNDTHSFYKKPIFFDLRLNFLKQMAIFGWNFLNCFLNLILGLTSLPF